MKINSYEHEEGNEMSWAVSRLKVLVEYLKFGLRSGLKSDLRFELRYKLRSELRY